jgi:tetratricopeptide (TPR) repeat protein
MNKQNFKIVVLLLNFFLVFYAVQAQENPRAAEAQQLLNQALASLTEEKYDDTIEKITKVLEIYPKSGDIYSIRALAYKGKNDNDKAIDDLTKALSLQISPDGELRSRKLRGMMFYEKKKYDEAIKDLDFAIAKDSSDFRAFVFRGWSYYFKSDYEPAIADFNAALKLSPQEKEIRRFRAQAYFYLGNYEKAIEDINEELRVNKTPAAEAYKIRANAYRKLGKNDLAEADEKKFVELGGKIEQNIQPKKPQTGEDKLKGLLEKSQKHFENEEWDSAIQVFTEIISFLDKTDENLYAVYFARGRSFYQSEKYDLALSDYNEVIKRRPDLSDGYTFRGEVYIVQNQLDLALFDFNKAIRIDPKNILAYRRRAEVYSLKKEYDKVIKDCDEVLKLDPKFMSAWFYRAEAYFEKGNYQAALSDISEYIKLESSNSGAYSFRAKVYRKLGEEKLAKADEQKAEQLSSKKK